MFGDQLNNNLKPTLQIKSSNFLFDVIVPTIYAVDNIKLVQNYMKKLTPTNKLQELKKAKLNSKIQQIVNKTAMSQNQNQFQHKPLLKKYQKQQVKLISQFSKSEVFRHQFAEQISSSINFKQRNKMVMSDLLKNDSDIEDSIQMRNSSIYEQSNKNMLLLELNDRKLTQKTRARQQNFQFFKQKMKKVVQKSKKLNVNKTQNRSNKKIDFYLTQISPQKSYKKIKVILNDQYAFKNHLEYSKELKLFGKDGTNQESQLQSIRQLINRNQEKNSFVRSIVTDVQKQNKNKHFQRQESEANLRQYRSVDKLRPKTAGNNTTTNSSLQRTTRSRSVLASTYSSKKMRLSHYCPSASEENITKKSVNQRQKQKCYNLLDNIQNILEQIPGTNKLMQRKISQMQKQWQFQMQENGDGSMKKVIQMGLLPASQQTLILMQRKRVQQIQKMDMQLTN